MPFVVRPIPFPRDAWHAVQANQTTDTVYATVHPFQRVLRWQQEIMADPQLTKSCNAARAGLSRARVAQILNLLQLPILIQQRLQNPPHPLRIHSLSERRLPAILPELTRNPGCRTGRTGAVSLRILGEVEPSGVVYWGNVAMRMRIQNGILWFAWLTTGMNELVSYVVPLHACTSFLYMRVKPNRKPAHFQAHFEIAKGQQDYFTASLSTFKPAALASAI